MRTRMDIIVEIVTDITDAKLRWHHKGDVILCHISDEIINNDGIESELDSLLVFDIVGELIVGGLLNLKSHFISSSIRDL